MSWDLEDEEGRIDTYPAEVREEQHYRPNDRILSRGRTLRIRCQTPECRTMVEFPCGNCSEAVLGQRALQERAKGVFCRECRLREAEARPRERKGPDPALSYD